MPAIFAPRSRTRIGVLVFDGVSSDEHEQTVSTTSEPIEDGSLITDHALVEPRPLRMTVIATRSTGDVSPTPLSSYDPARHEQLYQRLLEIQRSVALLEVVTAIESYTSMLITRVRRARRSIADTNRAVIDVEFKEIQVSKLQQLENLADGVVDLAQAETQLGAQGTVDVGEFGVP